jgi:hypothetical protein
MKQIPSEILLDQYHVKLHIRPKNGITASERARVKRIIKFHLTKIAEILTATWKNKVRIEISQ